MRVVLFLDLDDTIFQTRPKCPVGEDVFPAAYRRDGTPLSFMTHRQRALLDLWFRAATVIPTTARNLDAFRRVDLPFDRHAILDFGGVVLLPDGAPDADWDAIIRPQARRCATELHAVHRDLERFIHKRDLGANARVISDFDMPLYVVVKHPDGDSSKLQTIHDELLPTLPLELFFIHANDNNLSLVPRFLGKEHAVRHVVERHFADEPVVTIGMGDSLTDAAFLDGCDFSLMPRGAQLARRLFANSEGS